MGIFKELRPDAHVLIGTPLVAWKMDRGEWNSWLQYAEEIRALFPRVEFFCSVEIGPRGIEPFKPLFRRLDDLGGMYWTYHINDHHEKITTRNRLIRIETGRNLIREFAQRRRPIKAPFWGEEVPEAKDADDFDAILYVDSDMELRPEHLAAMLEVDRPLVGVHVPAYCLAGPPVENDPRVEEHWTTAGMLLVNSPAFYDLVWHHNAYLNLSDDPSFQRTAARLQRDYDDTETWGMTWVRKDVHAKHEGKMVSVEERSAQR